MTRLLAALLALAGLALALPGGWLIGLGGSPYYLVAGLAMLLSAVLLWNHDGRALSVFAVLLAGSLAWALWEVGPDWWQLAPRGGVLVVFGLLLLLTPLSGRLYRGGRTVVPLALALVAAVLVAGWSMLFDEHDLAGTLPGSRLAEANPADPTGGGQGAAAALATAGGDRMEDGEWLRYGRSNYGQRWSPLDQVTTGNVASLVPAWTYRTGDIKGPDDVGETTYQVTPIKVGDTLYLCTPHDIAIALDAATGKEKWRFDAQAGLEPNRQHQTCRGVTYYDPALASPSGSGTLPAEETGGPAPRSGGPETAATEAASAQTSAPDVTAPQDNTTEADTAQADTAQAGAAQPEAQPETARPETAQPDSAADASAEAQSDADTGTDTGTGTGTTAATTTDTGASPATEVAATDSAAAATPAQITAGCGARVYLPTADARLIALDAQTGQPCPGFGDGGTLNLTAGMPYNPAGYYYSTSPPVALDGKLIIGGAVNDNFSVQSPSGVIRAFDTETGELLWNWDSGNPDYTDPIDIAGGETYTANSPNSWSVFSVDRARGMVYIPLGNQVPDQLGMGRSAAVEAHSSSIVALDVNSGQQKWVFQGVHHDLWDMDVPAQPVLIDLTIDGASVPALVGPTKQGDIYVLNRETGEPILPVTEEPAPQGTIPEDHASPTQPTSALSFKPAKLEEKDMWGATLFDQLGCRIQYHRLNYEGRYTPPSLNGSIIYPGNFGVFNWGSVAVDPERQVMFGMPTYLPFTSRLIRAEDMPPKGDGKASEQGLNRNEGAPYGVYMGPFLGLFGVPCNAPPWGYVAGADLTDGTIAWKHRNGTVMDMTPLPLPLKLGVPGIGGPMMTRGGVAFLGAAVDDYLRGYDVTTGRQLWQARLPAGGQSTPMTYMQDGRQYVLIVAGGHGSVGTRPGDYVMTWTLPQAGTP